MSRTYPTQIPSERAVLGGVILDPAQLPALAADLRAEDFHRPEHGALWLLLLHMTRQREPIDMVSVPERVAATGRKEDFGGLAYVLTLPDQIPSTVNLHHYASIVRKAAIMRRLLTGAGELADEASASGDGVSRLVRGLLDTTMELSGQRKRAETIGAVGLQVLQGMQDIQEGRQEPAISTPWPQLDALIGGLDRGAYTILAARPSMGKTAVALNLALHLAQKGHAVGICSLEMRSTELVQRCLASLASVSLTSIRRPKDRMGGQEWDQVIAAQEELDSLPISITDASGMTPEQVAAQMQRWGAEGVELAIVDHLGEMRLESRGDRQDLALGDASKLLKDTGRDNGMHTLALSQLNRGVEKRPRCIPERSDLRDSGKLEEQADNIVFVYRGHYYYPSECHPEEMQLLVRKARQGEQGDCTLKWQGAYQRVTDPEAEMFEDFGEVRSAK